MVLINNTDLNSSKKLAHLLSKNYGLDQSGINLILKELRVDKNIRMENLDEDLLLTLNTIITNKLEFPINLEMKKLSHERIKKLRSLKNYRGMRHILNLPANGQRTKTNAKTSKLKN